MRAPVWRLTRELRAIGADYVACQLDAPNLLGGLAGLFADARRVLLSFRNANPSNFPTLFKPWYRDFYLALAASPRVRLTGNSLAGNDDYARWLDVAPEAIQTIHNGFSPEGFASLDDGADDALRRELGIASDATVVSALFRWSAEKDPDTFLEVARRIVAAHDDVVVLHAGDGPELAAARNAIEKSGLAARIRLLGTRRDSGALLRASQLLLLTSTFEGLSNTLLEAQFFGVPIVATAVGGTPEVVVDGETGLLADAGDAEALARRSLDLLDDPERRRRLGDAGRRRVAEHFSVERLATETLATLGG
jgi:glycosyltransferase involved in cell wall biosynthesis